MKHVKIKKTVENNVKNLEILTKKEYKQFKMFNRVMKYEKRKQC